MQTVTMCKRLTELGEEAATRIAGQIKREPSLERIVELEGMARELGEVSPHRLRHGLAHRLHTSGADAGYIQTVLGHQDLATTMRYGKPNDPVLRAVIGRANGSSAK